MRFRSLHRWDLSYTRATRLQEELAPRVVLRGGPRRPRLVAGADVSYERGSDFFFASVLLLDGETMEPVEKAHASGTSPFPYIPGLLSFREAPLLLRAFRRLKGTPDLVMIDGQGIAHPRGFGLAAHVGLILGVPAVGCAKSLLVGEHDEPGPRRGDRSPLLYKGRRVGTALRTRDGVKPVFVSPGHRIGFTRSAEAVLLCGRGYRLPEPTRLAHQAVNRFRKEGTD